MTVPETQKDILSYLDHVTREFDPERIERFTTVDIARAMSISRNLASQYLNDLVRRGLLVKAGIRPVCYFHRHDIERYLQARLDRSAFDTVDELLGMRGAMPGKGFDRAIGHSLSLSSAIEQMRVAMGYPPCGLPVLIMGASGTGKTFMVKLMLEYGKGAGLIAQDGEIVTVDCSRCPVGTWDIEREYFGEEGHSGWSDRARGGILLFKYIDLLPRPQREFLFTHALLAARASQDSEDRGLRFVFTTTVPADSDLAREFSHRLPVIVPLPALRERTPEERREIALHFLKDEGRRMGVDVLITRGAFNCLTNADFDDNISELRRSITNACAEAYLERGGASNTIVRTYRLPANVLSRVTAVQAEGDGELVDTTRAARHDVSTRSVDAYRPMLEVFGLFKDGAIDATELERRIAASVKSLEDNLAAGHGARGPRLDAFTRLLGETVTGINEHRGSALSYATARVMAQLAYEQLWPDDSLPRWKIENKAQINGMITLIVCTHVGAARLAEEVIARTKRVLGIDADALSRLVIIAHIALMEGDEALPPTVRGKGSDRVSA